MPRANQPGRENELRCDSLWLWYVAQTLAISQLGERHGRPNKRTL
jgi:hypothetical protein